jgi:archaellum component FlaC
MVKMLFSSIWWFGFAVAISLMLGLYGGIEFIENYVGILFLAVGIQHMVILVILGFFAIINERDDNIEVGSRVATMGYLHTLIGTSVALIMTSKFGGAEMIEHIDAIIAPIGSALITSIIGWAFGKEMERERYRYKLSSTEESDNALEFLADKVKRSALMIEQGSQKWMQSMDESTTQLISSSQKLEESITAVSTNSQHSIEELTKSLTKLHKEINHNLELMTQNIERDLKSSSEETQRVLNSSKEQFKEQFEQIERQVANVERNFDSSSKDANRVFKKSIETFDSGLAQMGIIAKEWDRHIRSMKKFSTHSESALDSLTDHSQKIIDEFSTVAKSLPNAGKVMSDIDDFLSKLKRDR